MKLSNLFAETLSRGCKGPSENPADFRPRQLLARNSGDDQKDIAEVISRYMKIDTNNMEIQISKASTRGKGAKTPSIYANIPILDLHKIS